MEYGDLFNQELIIYVDGFNKEHSDVLVTIGIIKTMPLIFILTLKLMNLHFGDIDLLVTKKEEFMITILQVISLVKLVRFS